MRLHSMKRSLLIGVLLQKLLHVLAISAFGAGQQLAGESACRLQPVEIRVLLLCRLCALPRDQLASLE